MFFFGVECITAFWRVQKESIRKDIHRVPGVIYIYTI